MKVMVEQRHQLPAGFGVWKRDMGAGGAAVFPRLVWFYLGETKEQRG